MVVSYSCTVKAFTRLGHALADEYLVGGFVGDGPAAGVPQGCSLAQPATRTGHVVLAPGEYCDQAPGVVFFTLTEPVGSVRLHPVGVVMICIEGQFGEAHQLWINLCHVVRVKSWCLSALF